MAIHARSACAASASAYLKPPSHLTSTRASAWAWRSRIGTASRYFSPPQLTVMKAPPRVTCRTKDPWTRASIMVSSRGLPVLWRGGDCRLRVRDRVRLGNASDRADVPVSAFGTAQDSRSSTSGVDWRGRGG